MKERKKKEGEQEKRKKVGRKEERKEEKENGNIKLGRIGVTQY